MKIVVTQTRQVQQYEPRRIEVHIDTEEENLQGDWEEFVSVVVESIDRILWPENYVNDDEEEKKNGDEPDEFWRRKRRPNPFLKLIKTFT